MSPEIILGTFVIYTVTLFVVAWFTSRHADSQSFFIGNHKSPWFVVAYGMIGASLSGVTFISVPGWVGDTGFSYMVIVIGYVFGYLIITTVLLPLYYRLNLTSIYTYLNQRFGNMAYKTGALFFLLSRIVGASFRMFLVVSVLQAFVMDYFGVPFWVTVLSFLVIIQLYTMKGGIKTIIWTDTLQTTFMLLAVVVSIGMIMQQMGTTFTEMIATVCESDLSNMIVTDVDSKENVIKLFFSGMFITIVMTGLDQDMMQKNLSCRNIGDAQKNMVSLSLILVPVNLLFLFLGAVLYLYAAQKGIVLPDSSDHLFPMISFEHLGVTAGVVFIIGLVSAAYSSADSALTALTTSFSIDILGLDKKYAHDENLLKKKRYWVHLLMSAIIIFAIISFRIINNQAVIAQLFTFAGFTYGPLLGLYAFGMFTKFKVYDRFIPIVAIAAPVISYFFSHYSEQLFNGYQVGFELLIINGALTFLGLFMIRKLNP
ncbi:MAG: sodium:solute symporter [Bacteroidetes bacterium CG_4_9_14_3_um_filter_41_19]|nr:MAG: sodium:solute symporter [Bacteroidetes bacterium CG_4_9_14_3_um_filter_41_19]